MAELRARLAADEREVRKMQHALRSIGEDPYYLTIELKYFDNVKDADAALRLRCDPATVRRNRGGSSAGWRSGSTAWNASERKHQKKRLKRRFF